MRTIRVRDGSELDAAEWDALAAEACEPNPFAERWFVSASLRHLGPARGVRLIEVRSRGRLIGAGLFDTHARYGRIPVRHVENWRHPNQFVGAPLIARSEEARVWQAVLGELDCAGWARGFLHVVELVEDGPAHRGLAAAAAALGRPSPIVHRTIRPLLETDLSPADYHRRNVRSKRRSEEKRHRARLAELGRLELRELTDPEEAPAWAEDFLALEAAGWKGRAGSALASSDATAAFFRETIAYAARAGRLQFLRLDLDGWPIAMMTCLLAPPGAFGFKSAFDERYARYSPGILLLTDQLRILDRPDVAWTDSCASGEHPTTSLWSERRPIVRVTVPLGGIGRTLAYRGARLLEEGAHLFRRHLTR